MSPPSGARLKCSVCGSEAILVRSQQPDLQCCGQPLEVVFTRPEQKK